MLYQLTQKNIHDKRLTDDDMSSGLVYHVTTFPLRSFPYSEELLLNQNLPDSQLKARAEAIYYTLKKNGLVNYGHNFSWKSLSVFTFEDAQEVAKETASTMRFRSNSFFFNGEPLWDNHFALIAHYGYVDANKHEALRVVCNDDQLGRMTQNVFPGILNEEISVKDCLINKAAFGLIDEESSSKNYWANRLRVPPELLENVPDDRCHILGAQLHEKRHIHQISIQSECFAARYYEELDADLASAASLKESGIGTQTIEARTHARYFDLFCAPPKYWIAPALEDISKGKTPKNFFQVHRTVLEIKIRLAESFGKQPFSAISSEELQQRIGIWNKEKTVSGGSVDIDRNIKCMAEITDSCIGKNPAPIFSELRKLLEQNVFTDPFTQHVAYKIVSAAHYFNPDFVTADYAPSRQRLQDRLRSTQNTISYSP